MRRPWSTGGGGGLSRQIKKEEEEEKTKKKEDVKLECLTRASQIALLFSQNDVCW